MPNSISKIETTQPAGLASAEKYLPHKPSEKKVLFLVTDIWEYYQEIMQNHFFVEDLVWISPKTLLNKNGHEIRELLFPATAVLIDWSARSANLLHTLRHYRLNQSIPVLALCGEQEAEHVAALIMGADGTISRTFNPIMLDAKLVAYGRSMKSRKHEDQRYPLLVESLSGDRQEGAKEQEQRRGQLIGTLEIDVAARALLVREIPIKLTPIEFDLLALLIANEGICLKRDDMINKIWGIGYETGTNFLDVHIHSLRRKLKKADFAPCIFTVRGVGYRFDTPAELPGGSS